MRLEDRLSRLEQKLGANGHGPVRFTMVESPDGLSPEEKAAWWEAYKAECERRGEFCFTLDLGGNRRIRES